MRTRKNATQDELDAIPGHLEITREEAWMILAHRRGVLFTDIRELPTEAWWPRNIDPRPGADV